MQKARLLTRSIKNPQHLTSRILPSNVTAGQTHGAKPGTFVRAAEKLWLQAVPLLLGLRGAEERH